MSAQVDPIEALRGVNRSTNRSGSLSRKTLVVFQAALSLVLLSASGLLTAALHNLENQDLGFDQDGRTIVNIDPQLASYRTEQLTPLYRRIHDSMASIPGVSSVGSLQLFTAKRRQLERWRLRGWKKSGPRTQGRQHVLIRAGHWGLF